MYLFYPILSLFALTLFLSCSDNPRLDFPSEDDLRQKTLSSAESSSSVGESSSSYYAESSSSSLETAVSSSSEMSSSGIEQSSSSVKESSSSYYAESSSSSLETAVSSSSEMSSSSVEQSSSSVKESSSSSLETAVSSSSETLVCGETNYEPAEKICCNNFLYPLTKEHYGTTKKQFCDSRDGKVYVYVKIDQQYWMAENLNYNANGSECYNKQDSNCTIYGRLYNWGTAMALSSSCNSSSCTSQVNAKHRGICPSGWHLPSNAEWNVLMKSVNPSCVDNSNCDGAGTKLKATSGWNGSVTGTDELGFSALPGGYGSSNGSFGNVGGGGSWWGASEYDIDSYAYLIDMFHYEYVHMGANHKSLLLSVRCLQN
jgi:uncharacterized protein (TIGR02145 family)